MGGGKNGMEGKLIPNNNSYELVDQSTEDSNMTNSRSEIRMP